MSVPMDPYHVLGLDPGASQAEVKRAYRRLAKALHPDAAGEDALPRFLAVQEAYERLTGTRVRTVRSPASPAGTGAPEGFREPWRADPARARAAREQARGRRAWPGGQAGWESGGGGTAPGRRPSTAGGARDARDARGRRSTTSSGAGTESSGPGREGWNPGASSSGATASGRADGSGRSPGRRRASRKATLGSTSYDEAREPADRAWAGASWYGPTTGEYWIVNPREYADPRKHGPGYTSRGHLDEAGVDPDATSQRAARSRPFADERPSAGRSSTGTGKDAATGTSTSRGSDPEQVGSRPAPSVSPVADSGLGLDGILGSLATPRSESWRRVGIVLLAWPPLGLAAATAIGQATGCLSYSVTCDTTDRLLPWLAQGVLLLLLLASPALARVLGAGTIAALVALVPGVGLLTALGGTSSPAGAPVLAGWLALAWLGGVTIGARRALRRAAEAVPDTRPSGSP